MTQRNSPRVLMQYHCFVIRVLVKRRTENGMKREKYFVFFVLGFFVPLENFSLIWRRNRWRAANFDLCSALMATDQWRLFSMPQPTVTRRIRYYSHLRGPVTHTYCRAFGSGTVNTCFLRLRSVAISIRTSNLSHADRML